MQYDVWSVKVKSDVDFYVVSTTPTGAATLVLANTTPGINGYGYKVSVTAVSSETTKTFTITGVTVGGVTVSEAIAGPGAGATVYTTNYFAKVTQVTVSAATTGAIEVGYGGALALPPTRIKGLYYVGSGSGAGSIVVTRNSNSLILLEIDTPQSATQVSSLYMAAEGIRTAYELNDFAIVTVTTVTSVTLICG